MCQACKWPVLRTRWLEVPCHSPCLHICPFMLVSALSALLSALITLCTVLQHCYAMEQCMLSCIAWCSVWPDFTCVLLIAWIGPACIFLVWQICLTGCDVTLDVTEVPTGYLPAAVARHWSCHFNGRAPEMSRAHTGRQTRCYRMCPDF